MNAATKLELILTRVSFTPNDSVFLGFKDQAPAGTLLMEGGDAWQSTGQKNSDPGAKNSRQGLVTLTGGRF